MPIPVVSYLETSPPTNPNYGVVADDYFIGGWRAVADVAARDAVYSGRRKAGMRVYTIAEDLVWRLNPDLVTWHLELPGGAFGKTIYVDPAGDDDAPGTSGDPVQTIFEATKRIPENGLTRLWLSGDTHELTDHSAGEERTVVKGRRVYARGENTVNDTVQFASIVNNVITCTKGGGSPNWTVDEHTGRWLRWFVWGPSWDDYGYGWRILSNTADALTCAVTWVSPGLGGSFPKPSVGTDLDIVTRATKIVRNTTSDSYTNRLFYDGQVIWQDVVFDGSGPSSNWGIGGWGPGSEGQFYWCEFLDHNQFALDGTGAITVVGCYFRGTPIAIVPGRSLAIINGDCYFDDCAVAVQGSGVAMSHSYYSWAKDCWLLYEVQGPGNFNDGSLGYWLDNCGRLARVDGNATYLKTAAPLQGFDSAKRDLTAYVVSCNGANCDVDLYDSSSINVGPDSGFFLIEGTQYDLSDYVANGADALFPHGNRISG